MFSKPNISSDWEPKVSEGLKIINTNTENFVFMQIHFKIGRNMKTSKNSIKIYEI